MKIVRLQCWSVTTPLESPYAIAYESVESATNVFVQIDTDSGLSGFGCAAPDQPVTGETPEGTMRDLNDIAAPLLEGEDPIRYALLLENLTDQLPTSPSARAGVDMALFDIVGKACGQPVWRLLGGYRESIATSITIGVLPRDATVERAREFVAQGFSVLKLKGGIDVEDDIERLLAVRDAVGTGIELRFDANQGYTFEDAKAFVDRTRSVNLELLEQPTPKGTPDLLGRVTDAVHIPIMADESLLSLRDAFCIASEGLADMVNVKLMKVGGIFNALQVNAVAKSAQLEVMVGCMDECGLAIAAGLHYALARKNVAYADLDGHFDLIGDPSSNAVTLRNGVLYPLEAPGFGWTPA